MNIKQLEKALRRAYSLGQTYWQQADSEYTSQWKKADATAASFEQHISDTCATILVSTSADVAASVVRTVAELPDRNSPEGWPEAMLVTSEELHQIVLDAIAQWVDNSEVAP